MRSNGESETLALLKAIGLSCLRIRRGHYDDPLQRLSGQIRFRFLARKIEAASANAASGPLYHLPPRPSADPRWHEPDLRRLLRHHARGDGRMSFPWTEENIALLKKLWGNGQGISKEKIACELGCGRNAVSSKLDRLGLLNTRPKQPKKESPLPRIASAKPPRSKFNPGPPPGRQPDHSFGRINTIKPWNPPALAPDDREFVLSPPVPFLKLEPGRCHWPMNDPPRGEEYLFCGA